MPPADPITEHEPASPGNDDPDPSRSCARADPGSDADRPTIAIDLTLNVDDDDPPITGWLDAHARRAVELAGVTRATLGLVVVGDEEMADLHKQYTGVAGTTDVLTFDLRDDAESVNVVEGDIVVCLDEARRQAAERGHPVRHELLLYVVHGLLHLLGEDDHDEDGYQRMHAREDDLLRRLGVGAVFDPGQSTGETGVPLVDDKSTGGAGVPPVDGRDGRPT